MWTDECQEKMFSDEKREDIQTKEYLQQDAINRLDELACKIADGEIEVENMKFNHDHTYYMNEWERTGTTFTLKYNYED